MKRKGYLTVLKEEKFHSNFSSTIKMENFFTRKRNYYIDVIPSRKLQTSLGCVLTSAVSCICLDFCSTVMHTQLFFFENNNRVIFSILTGLFGLYEKSRPPMLDMLVWIFPYCPPNQLI